MNPQQPSQSQTPQTPPTDPTNQQSQDQGMKNPLSVMQAGERTIFTVKRHPIGILFIYAAAAAVLLALGVILFVAAPSLLPDNKSQITGIGAILFIITTIIIVIFALIANKVYWGNAWILTDDSLTQVKQTSLFNKQSSQLSLENLEDITAEQNGILTHMFNYGVVKAETAGERSKFMFTFCPNPDEYAKQILQARELFNEGHNRVPSGTNVNTQT